MILCVLKLGEYKGKVYEYTKFVTMEKYLKCKYCFHKGAMPADTLLLVIEPILVLIQTSL